MIFEKLRLTSAQIALAVATALLLTADIYFGVSYLRARDEKMALEAQYEVLETSLQRLVAGQNQAADPDAIVGALAFPNDPPGLELTDLIIRSARDSGVELLSMRSVSGSSETIGSGEYRTAQVDLRLRAQPGRAADFFARLETSGMQTLLVDNLTLASVNGQDEIDLQVLAYARGSQQRVEQRR